MPLELVLLLQLRDVDIPRPCTLPLSFHIVGSIYSQLGESWLGDNSYMFLDSYSCLALTCRSDSVRDSPLCGSLPLGVRVHLEEQSGASPTTADLGESEVLATVLDTLPILNTHFRQ